MIYAWHKISAIHLLSEWLNEKKQFLTACNYNHFVKSTPCIVLEVKETVGTHSPYVHGEGRE